MGNRIKAYAPAWHDHPKSDGLQRRINCKIRCWKGALMRCLSISLSFRLLQTTYSHIIGICKMFSCYPSWHMLFWLLKDAWLTCKRCSFGVLPTPFWGPIKHLLRTDRYSIDWLPVTDLLFARILFICRWFVCNYVMTFQNPICILNVFKWKGICNRRMKIEWEVDGLGIFSSVLPLKLCEKHPRI